MKIANNGNITFFKLALIRTLEIPWICVQINFETVCNFKFLIFAKIYIEDFSY